MKTAILIDSGCDVSEELVQRYHMKVMRLHVIYPDCSRMLLLVFYLPNLLWLVKSLTHSFYVVYFFQKHLYSLPKPDHVEHFHLSTTVDAMCK